MTAHRKPTLHEQHEAPLSIPNDAEEQDREQKDKAIAEQSDDDSPRNPSSKGSVPVSER